MCLAETLGEILQMHPSWMAQLDFESQRRQEHVYHGRLHKSLQELQSLNTLPSDVVNTLEQCFFGLKVICMLVPSHSVATFR